MEITVIQIQDPRFREYILAILLSGHLISKIATWKRNSNEEFGEANRPTQVIIERREDFAQVCFITARIRIQFLVQFLELLVVDFTGWVKLLERQNKLYLSNSKQKTTTTLITI